MRPRARCDGDFGRRRAGRVDSDPGPCAARHGVLGRRDGPDMETGTRYADPTVLSGTFVATWFRASRPGVRSRGGSCPSSPSSEGDVGRGTARVRREAQFRRAGGVGDVGSMRGRPRGDVAEPRRNGHRGARIDGRDRTGGVAFGGGGILRNAPASGARSREPLGSDGANLRVGLARDGGREPGGHGGSGGKARGTEDGRSGLRPGSAGQRGRTTERPKADGGRDRGFIRDRDRRQVPQRSACREREQLLGRRAHPFGEATRGPNHHATRRPYRCCSYSNVPLSPQQIFAPPRDRTPTCCVSVSVNAKRRGQCVGRAAGRRRPRKYRTMVRKAAAGGPEPC